MDDGTSEPRTCEICGKPLYRNNTTGICSGKGGTKACKSARLKTRGRKNRAVPEAEREACAVCGTKLRADNEVGVCRKTPECRKELKSRRRQAARKGVPDGRRVPRERARRVPAIPAGTVFGRWTTLEESPRGNGKVLCRCACDNKEVLVGISNLRRGVSNSCGCLKRERCGRWPKQEGPYLPAGYVSGRITTLEDAAKSADDVRVRCECGNDKEKKNAQRIKSGLIESCGCLVGEILRTHGQSGHPLYSIWRGIVGRGSNPASRDYWKYGAIGRTTCEGYRTAPDGLLRFAEDMGPRPGPGYSTDRLRNTGGYWCGRCPECVRNGWPLNVAWRTQSEQTLNRDCLAKVVVLAAEVERLSRTAAPRSRKPPVPAQGALF